MGCGIVKVGHCDLRETVGLGEEVTFPKRDFGGVAETERGHFTGVVSSEVMLSLTVAGKKVVLVGHFASLS